MKIARRIAAILVLVGLFSWYPASYQMPPDEQYIRQLIPIEIQNGKPVTIEISSLSGNGGNDVGIRCSPDVWQALGGKDNIAVRLMSSNKQGAKIADLGPADYKLWPVESFYYLFSIGGEYRASASVEITFRGAPEGVTHAKIIVFKTPADTAF
jgi:hypothetical protein